MKKIQGRILSSIVQSPQAVMLHTTYYISWSKTTYYYGIKSHALVMVHVPACLLYQQAITTSNIKIIISK